MTQVEQLSDPSDPNVIRQLQGDVLYITGLTLNLDQGDMPWQPTPGGGPLVQSTADVVIQADTVILGSVVANPGRNVTITARRLVMNPGATIDVSGAAGTPNWAVGDVPDPTDTTPGAPGVPGAVGGTGGGAGNITLYAAEVTGADEGSNPAIFDLFANGGVGGAGQHGGDGNPGAEGQPGVTPPWPPQMGPQPGDGGIGGDGGPSGTGGAGGQGGVISVNLVAPLAPAFVVMQSGGGQGGGGGIGGNGAPGGPGAYGGTGGRYGVSGRAGIPSPPGAPGPAGSAALAPPGQFTLAALGQQSTLALLQQVQQRADSAFLGQDYATAAKLYGSLIGLTQADVAAAAPTADMQARAAINAACVCELSRLKQGLDFFGLRPDWAPTLTLALLQAEIDAMVTLATQLETSLQALLNAQNTAAEKRQALEDAQTQAANRLLVTQSQISAMEGQLALFVASLARQQDEINAQMDVVEAMQFNDIFAQQHPGCSTMGALKACSTVVSTALSVESDYTAVTTAVATLADSGTIMDAVTNGISAITTVEQTVQSVQQGYAGIVNLIDPKTRPDAGKLLANEAEYDQWIDGNITGCAQQADLKSAVSRYFDLVKTRNNNVLAYNAALLQKTRLQAEADQQTAAFESIAVQLASQNNPSDPAFMALIQNADLQIRTYLLRRINDELRAFNYWSVNNDGGAGAGVAMPTDCRLVTLTAAQGTISEAIDTATGNAGFPDTLQGKTISFTRAGHPDAFAALAASKDKRLILRSDVAADGAEFSGMAHVTVEQVQVTLPQYAGLTTGVLSVRVVHGGSGVFLQEDGVTSVRFSHAIHTTLYEYDFAQKMTTCTATLGDPEQGFMGLSPFTDWILDFGNAGIAIDFDTLSEVDLTFTGVCIPAQGI